MAVHLGADPIDIALDQVAALLTERMQHVTSVAERTALALEVAALWRVIEGHALDVGDSKLLAIASREYVHFIDVAIAAGSSPVP